MTFSDCVNAAKSFFFFWRRQPAVLIAGAHAAPEAPKVAIETGEHGYFRFKDAILDQLDAYFVYIKRMKTVDREAFDFYRQVGASIIPRSESMTIYASELSPWWRAGNRPGFGAVAFAMDPSDEKDEDRTDMIGGKFVYFQKMETPPAHIQSAHGDIYRLVIYYDKRSDKKGGATASFFVCVRPCGEVRLLKVLRSNSAKVWSRRHRSYITIPQREWRTPEALSILLEGKHEIVINNDERKIRDVHELARVFFCICANTYEQACSGARVQVTKGDLTAVFNIDIKRSAYFFADRDASVNADGKRRRIFHIVRPHRRALANGGESYVKLHFRGERAFTWNGYGILVSVSGLHHTNVYEFDAGSIDVSAAKAKGDRRKCLSMEGAGAMLSRHLSS